MFLPLLVPAGCGPLADVCREGDASQRAQVTHVPDEPQKKPAAKGTPSFIARQSRAWFSDRVRAPSQGFELLRELSRSKRVYEACLHGEVHVLKEAAAVLEHQGEEEGLERAQEAALGVFSSAMSGHRDGGELLARAGVLDNVATSCGLVIIKQCRALVACAGNIRVVRGGERQVLRLVKGAVQLLGQATLLCERDKEIDHHDAWYPLVRALTQLSRREVSQNRSDAIVRKQ